METSKESTSGTRARLLEIAHDEIHQAGFQSVSINTIIQRAGVSKGAFFHHFKNKQALGIALIDEVLLAHIKERWLDPLQDLTDPIKTIISVFSNNGNELQENELRCGCPLNNLAQEVSSVDESMRLAMDNVFSTWIQGFAQFIEQAQQDQKITQSLSARSIASTLVSFCEGTISLVKVSQGTGVIEDNFPALIHFLESIRERGDNNDNKIRKHS